MVQTLIQYINKNENDFTEMSKKVESTKSQLSVKTEKKSLDIVSENNEQSSSDKNLNPGRFAQLISQ